MAELADDPRVAELLLLLWDAPDRDAGIAISDLPDSLRDADLLTACEGAGLIQFARRKHSWEGGGEHDKLVLEPGWSVAELHKPGRKHAWQVLEEAQVENVPDAIRFRVQLGYLGSAEASRLALNRRQQEQPTFSQLDRFPLTPAGHVSFLESVRDEVHYAAEAKRNQLVREYENATIESMVRGIKWAEAGRRVSALAELPAGAVEQVAHVLRRELTMGTVERIDELLTPSVRALRDAFESFRNEMIGAAQLELDNLALAHYFIYRDLFPWFGPAMVEAGYELGERTHSREVQAIRLHTDAVWREITNLAPLHTADAWNHAAKAAGWKGRSGDIDSAAAAIKAWAAAKLANMPPGTLARLASPDAGQSDAPHADDALGTHRLSVPNKAKRSSERSIETTDTQPLSRLLSVFTNGMTDLRIHQASAMLQDDNLTTNEKLEGIDGAMPIPPTASAEQLGRLLGVTKQAVMKTAWWTRNRRGEKANEVGRRKNVHKQRASQLEPAKPSDEDE